MIRFLAIPALLSLAACATTPDPASLTVSRADVDAWYACENLRSTEADCGCVDRELNAILADDVRVRAAAYRADQILQQSPQTIDQAGLRQAAATIIFREAVSQCEISEDK